MNIFGWWQGRKARKVQARAYYEALVAQARQPVFYTDLMVPDTTDGRFDMIALHAFMTMELAGMKPVMRQALFDVMFKDLERATREMGVGDLSVGRHVKGMMRAFKGRFYAYQAAGEDPKMMADALRRNLYRKRESVDDKTVSTIVSYVGQTCAMMRAGSFAFAEIKHDRTLQQAA